MKRTILVWIACGLMARPAVAQVNTASLVGRVLDASNAVLVDARVTVTQLETRFRRTSQTDVDGAYEIAQLPPGAYEVTAQKDGFTMVKRTGIVLVAGDRVRFELTLPAGAVTESIDVVARAPLTNTESSALGVVVNSREVQTVPLNGHNIMQLVNLAPGATPSRPQTVASFTMNGSSQYGLNISLDGTDASLIETPTFGDPSQQSLLNTVSPESIEQIELKTATFSAEVGRATGGVVNIITKSGSNTFRGTAFEYLRNDALDARNFFAAAKDPLRQNQFGGNLGGPVIADRLFFFGSYEGSRATIGRQVTANVPTEAFRARAPSAFKAYFDALPPPTEAIAGNADAGIYRRSDNFVSNENLSNGRLDYSQGRSSLFVRYSLNKSENSTPNLLPINRQVYPITNHLLTASHSYVLSDHTLNEVRFGVDDWDIPRASSSFDGGLGGITITGILTSGNAEGILHFVDSTYSIADNLSHRAGTHSFKTGFEFRRLSSGRTQRTNPQFSYTTAANFLANIPASVVVTYGNLGTVLRQYQTGGFVQDDWQVRPRLTVNLGVRYEYFTALGAIDGRMVSPGEDPFGPFQPTGPPLWTPNQDNFEPRVGFAWDTTGTQKTVIRGGIGVYRIALPPFFIWNAATIDPKLPASATYTPADVPGLSYPLSGPLAAAYANPLLAVQAGLAPAVVSRFAIDPNRRDPYTVSWNLTAERQLGADVMVQASYVGTRFTHAPNNVAMNLINPGTKLRLDPTIGEIDLSTNGGRRWYDGLQLAVRKRLSHGLAVNGNYTFSHTDQCGGEDAFGPTVVQDWDNIAASCGTSALEVHHMLVVDYSYELPWGFTLGGFTQARSGLPANLVTGRDLRGNGFPNTQRPNFAGGSLYADDQTYLNWYNKAAFSNPAAGTFGNLGYDAARGPAFVTVNVSLMKRLAIQGAQHIQLRADIFNLLNHVNFSNPDSNINSPTFGRIAAADIPRQIQLSVRYQF